MTDPSKFVDLVENDKYLLIVFEDKNDIKGTMYETEFEVELEQYNMMYLEYSINDGPREILSQKPIASRDTSKIHLYIVMGENFLAGDFYLQFGASPDPVDGDWPVLFISKGELAELFPLEIKFHRIWLEK
ncbi:MAG TPA: hypothetical protein GX690_02590 [Tenericutes bacterium]|jgi:hypothetical protein|nr:hypothetical protein [Mycoplasmatota bacterium]